MERVHDSIAWYQKQIGSYDKQLWEQSVEKKLLKAQANVHHAPRKSVRVKTEFIDVDLIRGSTFSKPKPQAPWTYITRKAFIRVFLLPFCYRWWIQQTSVYFFTILLFLYLSQVITLFISYSNIGDSIVQDELTASEVLFPIIITVILGLIHSQTVLSHYSHKPPSRDSKLRQISKTKRRMKETEIQARNDTAEDTAQSTQLDNSALNKGNNSNTLPSGPSEHSANPSPQLVSDSPPLGSHFSLRGDNSSDNVSLRADANLSMGGNSSDTRMGVVSPRYVDSRAQWQCVNKENGGILRRNGGELRRRFANDQKSSTDEQTNGRVPPFQRPKCRKSDLEENDVDSAILPEEFDQETKSKVLLENDSRFADGNNFGNDSRFADGGSFGNDSHFLDGKMFGNDSRFADGKNHRNNSSFPNRGDFGNNSSFPDGGSFENDSHFPNGGSFGNDLSFPVSGSLDEFTDNVPSEVGHSSEIRNPVLVEDVIPEDAPSESLLIGNVVQKLKVVRSDLCEQQDLKLMKSEFCGHKEKVEEEELKLFKSDLCGHMEKEGSVKVLRNEFCGHVEREEKVKFLRNEFCGREEKVKVLRSDLYGGHKKIEVEESKFVRSDLYEQHKKVKAFESEECSSQNQDTYNGNDSQIRHLQEGIGTNETLPPVERADQTSDKNNPDTNYARVGERLDVEDFRDLCNRARAIVGSAKVRRRYCSLRTPEDLGEVSDCECPDEDLQESSESWRRKRRLSSARSADLGEVARSRVVPNKLTFLSEQVLKQERNSSENDPANSTPEDGSRVGISGVEWDDRIQSDLTTSSSYSTSCDSANELSDGESLDQQEILDIQHSWPSSSLNVINLLQPPTISNIGVSHIAPPDKVSCVIWEGNECKKVDLTALDIGWAIIDKVDNMSESSDYIWIGIGFSLMIGCVPLAFRAYHAKELPSILSYSFFLKMLETFYPSWRRNLIMLNGIIQRLCLSLIFFFLLSVADRTFKQRLLYAKHFCYLTSSRRARKFDMPHFRLNKVRNIKTWLSLRSYLKRRGPQRSVDVIVSATFLTAVCLVSLMCLQMLKDSDTYLDYLCNWELIIWCLCLGVYLLRFMTLGLKINKKYRNLSVLITEQINLYLQMEQKPHKKEELILANNVLKLAEDLLKELESPFKISGFSANPFIYNMTKVVVLSAFSTVLTELLGFKLKLYKIKFKA